MSFEDLPDDWPTRSLADTELARDVLDLVVRDSDRTRPGIAVLLCNDAGRLQQPVLVHDATPAEDRARGVQVLRTLVLDHALPDPENPDGDEAWRPALLMALVRPAGRVDDTDRAWHQAVIDVCREAGLSLLGVHLVTADRVETLPGPVQSSSAA